MCSTSLHTNHHIRFSNKLLILRINVHASVVGKMAKHKRIENTKSFRASRKAIALPVTFLMLFVSLLILITATYYFSITRISARTLALKTTGVEQEMLSLEKIIKFVSWSPGACEIHEFGDFGGEFKAVPTGKPLILNMTDDSSFYDVVFSSSVGKVLYELPASEEAFGNIFLKGDSRAIVNQSSSTTSQLQISEGIEHYELILSYRPFASATVTGSSNGRPVNSLRIYVVNLNSSEAITRLGAFRLRVSCSGVTSTLQTYNFTSPLSSLLIKANLDGLSGEVSLPISSNAQGAIVSLETIVCNVKLEDVGW